MTFARKEAREERRRARAERERVSNERHRRGERAQLTELTQIIIRAYRREETDDGEDNELVRAYNAGLRDAAYAVRDALAPQLVGYEACWHEEFGRHCRKPKGHLDDHACY